MDNLPKAPFTFNQFVKYPVYGVCFLLILYFVYKEFLEKNGYQTEIDYLKRELVQVRREKEELINALLIKNGIIYRQELQKRELDSTIREKVGEKAKQIIGGK